MRRKEPLYRKVNTTAHGVHHGSGPDYRSRRAKAQESPLAARMVAGKRRGLDYTPLFRFLLSRVGQPWGPTLKEAQARLDQEAPIFWMVARFPSEEQPYVRMGESSFYSGLYVDDGGLLQRVDPALNESSLEPTCRCCTHTFNGKRFTRAYKG